MRVEPHGAGTPAAWRRAGLLAGPAVAAALVLAPLGLPPVEARAAAVAALMAAWWVSEAVPLPVTSLLPLVLFPLLGVRDARAAAAPYADPAIFLFMGGFLLALAMEAQGLANRAARVIAASRFGARPALLLGAFCLATFSISAWINNTATTMIMLPVALATSARSDPRFAKALMLATAYFSSIGGIVTPVGTAPNVIFFGQAGRLGIDPQVSFLQWVAVSLPVAAATGLAGWALLARRFRVPLARDAAGAAEARALRDALGPPSRGERRAGALFAAAVLLWIARQDTNFGTFEWVGWETRLGLGGVLSDGVVAMAIGLLLLLVPSGAGRPLLTWTEAERGIPWGTVLLLGGGFALADGVQSSGLAQRIGESVAALRDVPRPIFTLAVTGVMTFLSELTSNTAQASLFLPLAAASASGAGMHPYALMVPTVLACSLAFMMPAGTPPNAIVFASGRVTLPEMAATGLLLNLAGIAVVSFVAPPLMRLFWGVG